MEDRNDIVTRMNQNFAQMSKSHKKIASYIMDHYDTAVFMTAATLGKEIGISESTVVRFAAGLGYDGYPKFQKALEEWVKSKWNSLQQMGAKYGNSSQSEILTSVIRADMEKM